MCVCVPKRCIIQLHLVDGFMKRPLPNINCILRMPAFRQYTLHSAFHSLISFPTLQWPNILKATTAQQTTFIPIVRRKKMRWDILNANALARQPRCPLLPFSHILPVHPNRPSNQKGLQFIPISCFCVTIIPDLSPFKFRVSTNSRMQDDQHTGWWTESPRALF